MPLRVLLVALALGVAAGCAADTTDGETDGAGAGETTAATVEAHEVAVVAAGTELAQVLGEELGSAVVGARLRYVACGSPVVHGVRVRAEDASAGTDRAPADAAGDLRSGLVALGWEIDIARPELVTATRDGLTLRIQPGPAAVPWSVTSACAATSAEEGEDYLDRPERGLDVLDRGQGG